MRKRWRRGIRPHRTTHYKKKNTHTAHCPVLFSAKAEVGNLCRIVNNKDYSSKGRNECSVNLAQPLVHCTIGMVYRIPLSCKSVYVGQTGRRLSVHLGEHLFTVTKSTGANLPAHDKKCGCHPLFDEAVVCPSCLYALFVCFQIFSGFMPCHILFVPYAASSIHLQCTLY